MVPAHLLSNYGLISGKNVPENQAVKLYFNLPVFPFCQLYILISSLAWPSLACNPTQS